MNKDEEQKLEKTIKQMNNVIAYDKEIKNMSIQEIQKLEQDIKDTKEFIKMKQGNFNELQKNIISSLEIQIQKRKKELGV